jgi:hypothetical protein
MRKPLGLIGGLVGMTVASAVLGALPASASTDTQNSSDAAATARESIVRGGQDSGVVTELAGGWDRCPNGYLCLFDGYDGGGTFAYFRTGSPNLAAQRINKAASSMWNRSPWHFVLYEGYGYTGRHNGTQPPGSRWNFDHWHGDNFFSSLRRA